MRLWIGAITIYMFFPAVFCSTKQLYWFEPIFPMTCLLWLWFFIRPNDSGCSLLRRCSGRLKRLNHDPFVWVALVLLGLVLVQWLNCGAARVMEAEQELVVMKSFSASFLPYSVKKDDAWKLFLLMLGGFSIVTWIRHTIHKKEDLVYALKLIMLGGVVFAILGIVQFVSGTDSFLWKYKSFAGFFSLFGYENHAGAYFVMMTALALGIALFVLMRNRFRGKRLVSSILAVGCVVLFSLSVIMSYSRSCYLFWGGVVAMGVLVFLVRVWPRISNPVRIGTICLVFATIIVGSFSAYGLANERMKREMSSMGDVFKFVGREFSVRTWQWEATAELVKDYPFFGMGYDSSKYMQPLRIPERWRKTAKGAGKANVHNDYLQFMEEVGIVGMGLFCLVVALLVAPVFSEKAWKNEIVWMGLCGFAANLVHATFDLPYRSFAILWLTAFLLALVNRYALEKSKDHSKITVEKNKKPLSLVAKVVAVMVVVALSICFLWSALLPVRNNISKSIASDDSLAEVELSDLKKAYYLAPHRDEVILEIAERLHLEYIAADEEADKSEALVEIARWLNIAYRRNEKNNEMAFLFSDVLEEMGSLWEAKNVLLTVYHNDKNNDLVREKLSSFYMRNGEYRKATKLLR